MLLYLSVVFRGNPQKGFKYIQAATAMAAELRLFGVEDTVTVKEWKELTEAEQASTAYAAWGAFNMITYDYPFLEDGGDMDDAADPMQPAGHLLHPASD